MNPPENVNAQRKRKKGLTPKQQAKKELKYQKMLARVEQNKIGVIV